MMKITNLLLSPETIFIVFLLLAIGVAGVIVLENPTVTIPPPASASHPVSAF